MGAGLGLESREGGTHQKNRTLARRGEIKQRRSKPGEAEPRGACSPAPRMAWDPPAPRGCPRLSAQDPSLPHRPGQSGQRARAAGQAGQGTRGRTAAFSTHTLCNTTATTSVRPSALQRGRTDTHPHAGPAHPSDTGEIWDEVGGDTRLLVNHIGGAPRRVGVQQAVHGAEPAEKRSNAEHGVAVASRHPSLGGGQGLAISPGWVLLDREGSLHVDGVALVFEHAVA